MPERSQRFWQPWLPSTGPRERVDLASAALASAAMVELCSGEIAMARRGLAGRSL